MGFYSHTKSSFFAVMMTTKRSQTIRLTLQNLNIFFFFSSNGKRGTRANVDRSRRIYSPLQLPLCDIHIKWLLWDSNSTFTAWETVVLTFRLGDLAQTHLSESTFFHAPICMFVFAFCLPFWSAHKLNSVHIPERAAVRTGSYSSLQNWI